MCPSRKITRTGDFLKVMETLSFVDKTLMLKDIIDNGEENMLITGPRRFGKSVNLSMIRKFFDVAENNRSKFEILNIKEYPKIIDEHCNKYAVLWVDMSWFSRHIDSLHSAIIAVRQITHYTYRKYENILLHSEKLKNYREMIQLWCDGEKHINLTEEQIYYGIAQLAEYLHVHYGTEVVLLVDEFDAICRIAVKNVDETELGKIVVYYFNVFSLAIKSQPSPFIFKAIFTGITAVTCSGQSGLNNLPKYQFLEDGEFSNYYGILVEEFDKLLEKPEYAGLIDQRNDALSFYNGYEFEGKKILCTYSIVNYLYKNSRNPKLPLKSYWCDTADVEEFSDAWRKEELQLILRHLINGGSISVSVIEKISPKKLSAVYRLLKSTDDDGIEEPVINVLLVYLNQLGYLGIVERIPPTISLSIPNEEIRSELKTILMLAFKRNYRFGDDLLQNCANHLNCLIDVTDPEDIKETFKKFKEALTKSCAKYLVFPFLNEATLEHLVFAVLIKTKFTPVSQVPVTISLSDNRRAKKLDLCFFRKDTGIIVELKFGNGGTAESAVEQIKSKNYCDIFSNANGRIKGIEKRAFVGIHLEIQQINNVEELSLTLAYTKDLAVKPVLV